MKHIFRKGSDASRPTLLLLHGTGGNEFDLLSLAEKIDPQASVLGVRGNVLEHGMPRFFRRLAEGVFDEEDLISRTKELNEFLDDAARQYDFDREHILAIGYSNGANIAASLLFHYDKALAGAILHHPMVPRRNMDLSHLDSTPVFITAGTNDPICPVSETTELNGLLDQAGADVQLHWENRGHQLTAEEVDAAANWYQINFGKE